MENKTSNRYTCLRYEVPSIYRQRFDTQAQNVWKVFELLQKIHHANPSYINEFRVMLYEKYGPSDQELNQLYGFYNVPSFN